MYAELRKAARITDSKKLLVPAAFIRQLEYKIQTMWAGGYGS